MVGSIVDSRSTILKYERKKKKKKKKIMIVASELDETPHG